MPYDYKVDNWTIGTLIYEMLYGWTPLPGSGKTAMFTCLEKAMLKAMGIRVAVVSYDDFYLTNADQQATRTGVEQQGPHKKAQICRWFRFRGAYG